MLFNQTRAAVVQYIKCKTILVELYFFLPHHYSSHFFWQLVLPITWSEYVLKEMDLIVYYVSYISFWHIYFNIYIILTYCVVYWYHQIPLQPILMMETIGEYEDEVLINIYTCRWDLPRDNNCHQTSTIRPHKLANIKIIFWNFARKNPALIYPPSTLNNQLTHSMYHEEQNHLCLDHV